MKFTLLALTATLFPAALLAAGGASPAPADISAKPDATGLLKAILTVNAPTLDTDGDALTDLSKIEVKRDGNVVKVFDAVTPGGVYEFTDTDLTNGYTSYSAIAYAGSAMSEESTTGRIFVGVDVPLAPKQLKAITADNKISFTWTKTDKKGANGERVRQDGVTYELQLLNDSYEPQKQLTETKGQTFDYYCPFNAGTQDLQRFGVRVSNRAGTSEYTYARVVTGAPYLFPYRESFGTGVCRSLVWQEGDGACAFYTEDAADSDAGSLYCQPSADGTATSFNFGKIAMANTLNPRLSFRLKGLADGDKLLVRVARADGAEATLQTISAPCDDWTLVTVDLSALKNEQYIIPKFQLPGTNQEALLIDDIRVEDLYTSDFAVMVQAPEAVIGETEVNIEIENVGLEPGTGAIVGILQNGLLTHQLRLDTRLLPGETVSLPTTVNVSGEDSFEVKAILHWIFDLNPANDIASAMIIPQEVSAEGPAAAIESIATEGSQATIYTIDGRKVNVSHPGLLSPGLYIIAGKKVVIK